MVFTIEEWTPEHPRWDELVRVITDENQAEWAFEPFFADFDRHFLVALHGGDALAGFLMFVVWEIGPHDRDHALVKRGGDVLTEAKIIAFGVREPFRRRGIGRALQERTLRRARELGCYQVRSVSGDEHPQNQQLKLSMGFAVEPMEREQPTLCFVMPLRGGGARTEL